MNLASAIGALSLSPSFLCFRIDMIPFGVKVLCIEPGIFQTAVSDTSLIKKNLQKLWDNLPQSVKDDYGDHYLETGEFL